MMTLTVAMVDCPFQEPLLFISLYLVVIGQGGHKPCVQAFGADQFHESNEEGRIAKNSFFNLWYFGMCSGAIAAMLIVFYSQDNMGWTIDFGILAIAMAFALVLFLFQRQLYRRQAPSRSWLARVAQVLAAVARKLDLSLTIDNDVQKVENGWFHTRILGGLSFVPINSGNWRYIALVLNPNHLIDEKKMDKIICKAVKG